MIGLARGRVSLKVSHHGGDPYCVKPHIGNVVKMILDAFPRASAVFLNESVARQRRLVACCESVSHDLEGSQPDV